MTTEQFEAEKYRELWKNGYNTGPNALPYAQYLSGLIHGNCLDIGCGDCTTLNELNNNELINCSGVDITIAQCRTLAQVYEAPAWSMPFLSKKFKFTLSTDVLEHLPPEKVEQTIKEIARITQVKTFHYIATCRAVTEYKGEQVHLTVQPAEWWHEQFSKFCGVNFELKFW